MGEVTPANVRSQYNCIGGWLILVAIGVVINPIRLFKMIYSNFVPVFSSDTWNLLTTPGTDVYHSLWRPLILFELIGNIILALSSVLIAIWFFQKKCFFPRFMIIFLLTNFIFGTVDYYLANLIPLVASQNDCFFNKEVARALLICVIWIPYFLVSERVKGTFVY